MGELGKCFSELSQSDKSKFLVRVVHEATINARATAYGENYQRPNGALLHEINEFVHRISGVAMFVLSGNEVEEQDAVMEMIADHFHARGGGRGEGRLIEMLRNPT